MICPRCQSENVPSAAFCDQCGVRLESPCPKCGEPNRPTARVCRNCGQSISQTTTSAPAPTGRALAPDTYVPKHLAEKILAARQSLEKERKQVTVLFADIRGSTSLVEGLDPEEAQKIIDPVLHVMMEAVHRYEGTVNQVVGDGIMALFGAPLAHEDHALRACYAALAMQEEMRRYRRRLGQSEESGLHIGVGMNSGEVVVRSIDNDLNIEYSALGLTANLAARMQELAGRGVILMTVSTLRQVEGFVQVKSLGTVQAKGISRPVEAHELLGATSARTRVQAGAVRGLTPLVGRRTEIEVFNKLLEEAGSGNGQLLAMVGEPGMGKSRLVHEFTRHQLRPGWLVLEGASVSYGKATPYLPLVEMLRHYFQLVDGTANESIRDQVVTHILELDHRLKDAIPPILSLFGIPPDEKQTAADEHHLSNQLQNLNEMIKQFNSMDPQQRRRHTLDVVKRLVIRESERQPLLVVFEDLHWVDSETHAFLDSLVDSLPMAQILLLVNYRPGFVHAWNTKSFYTQLRVDPLQPTSAQELLQHLLGPDKDLVPLKELLIERTDGNPFFVEESVRSLVEAGTLIGEKRAYRPSVKIDEVRVPSTVQSVVADRIDRLPIAEKHLLQTAAVIGVIVPLPLLRAVAGLSEDELQGQLAHLQAAEFLYESKLFPQLEYKFKHALTNEVAYGTLLHERRTALHGLIVTAIENLEPSNLPERIEHLAHHSYHGKLWDKAVSFMKEAGVRAVSQSSYRNAMLRFEQALEALEHLPQSRDSLAAAVDLRVEIRNALFILGEFGRGLPYLEAAKNAAVALNDHSRLGKIFQLMTAHWNLEGNTERAIASGREALRHATESEHIDLQISARYFLGAAHHSIGRYKDAADVFLKAITLIGDRKQEHFGTTGSLYVICRAWLARCLAQLGDLTEAIPFADESVKTAVEYGQQYSLGYAYYGAGVLLLIKGDYNEAVDVLECGLRVCETSDLPVHYPLVASCLGTAYASVGRSDEALDHLQRAVEHPAWSTRLGGQSLRMVWVADGYLRLGRLDEAEIFVQRGLELAAESKDKGSRAWLLRIMGEIAAQRQSMNSTEAVVRYEEALKLAQELNMRPLEAHCHLGLGTLRARAESSTSAHSELDAAAKLYRAMSMFSWLAVAEAAQGAKHLPA
jgi:predicted ATPase/class 3 adenylate cyclase